MIAVSVSRIQELKIFGSTTINSVSGNLRTKSEILDIRRAVISVRNLNRLFGRIGKRNAD